MGHLKYLIAKGFKIILNPPALKQCNIDKTARVCSGSELNNCKLDRYSYIGHQCFMVNASIGKFCSIGNRCFIGGANHPITFVSSSPVFHEGKNILKKNFSTHEIEPTPCTVIENDVWLGAGVYIKAGVRIGTGAVIGMNSVVTHDIAPYEIWAGNPAKLIRKRFDEKMIKELLNSQWWEFDNKKLERYAEYFNNPNIFAERLMDEPH